MAKFCKSLILLIFVTSLSVSAQNEIEKIVRAGIKYHDAGDYKKAIKTYKKALKIDKNSTLANYEIALSYLESGKYKKAIKYSDLVLKENKDVKLEAYICKGTAYDLMGNTKESIKVYNQGIEDAGEHYLFYYNLAVDYAKLNNFSEAEQHLFEALYLNPFHPNSHYLLASLNYEMNKMVPTILSSYFFLLVEPASKRAEYAHDFIEQSYKMNFKEGDGNPNQNTILLSDTASGFSAIELILSIGNIANSLTNNIGLEKVKEETFYEKTEMLFNLLGENMKSENDNFWWNFYIPFYDKINNSEYLEQFCKYISQSIDEDAKKWVDENDDKIEELGSWLRNAF